MFFQLATEETLVPPNLRTTHGEVTGEVLGEEAVVIANPILRICRLGSYSGACAGMGAPAIVMDEDSLGRSAERWKKGNSLLRFAAANRAGQSRCAQAEVILLRSR